MTRDELYLHEEITLLALRDKEGTIEFGICYQQALAGAMLAELLLNRRITVVKGKKKFINLVNATPFREPLLDECLETIATAKKRKQLKDWIAKFAGLKDLKHRVALGLCQRGILRPGEDKVLLIFKRKIYPELDPRPEKELLERLRQAIFTQTLEIEPRTVVLVSLADTTGLLKANFDKKKLKQRKRRIERIVNGEVVGKATKEAIEAMQAAVVAVCIVPAIVST